MTNAIKVYFADADEVRADCVEWALEISKEFVPDLVIFLAKSGFLFAEPLAACFDCEMADLEVSRPSNGSKDAIAQLIPRMPRPILAAALRSKTMYGYHDRNSERKLIRTERYNRIDFAKHHRVLIVDDSVDTGWSMLEALRAVRSDAPSCEVKMASYCVISGSEERAIVDYYRFKDSVVVTATSRYSLEHGAFLDDLGRWKAEVSRDAV